jgi:hypothetical protein
MGQECAVILRIGKPLRIAGVDGTDARGAAIVVGQAKRQRLPNLGQCLGQSFAGRADARIVRDMMK